MPKFKLTKKQITKLIRLYKNPNIKMDKPCKMFSVSDDTIRRAMEREDIPMRVTVGFCDKKNSNWKRGYSLRYANNVAIRHFERNECMVCRYKISTDVHHWDGNRENNNPDNLVLLCPNHHREVHLGLITKENINKKIKKDSS